MNQLQGHPGLDIAGRFAGPAKKQIPGSQAQVFADEKPNTGEVAGDLVAEQLSDPTLDVLLITGLEATDGFCPLRLNTRRISYGEG